MVHLTSRTQRSAAPRWGQERRLEFIDFRLRWDRTVNRGELVEFFGISTQQASKDLADYTALAPHNLKYDKNQKRYRATSRFRPIISRGDAQTYLALLISHVGSSAPATTFLGWTPPYDVVRLPSRPTPTSMLQRVVWAIRDHEELSVVYQSMRRPTPAVRWIAPHALAFDGARWHARAWCHENCDYRDFVISRIQKFAATRKAEVDGRGDTWWNTYIDVAIQPRRELTRPQRAAVEADFGMRDGRLAIRVRKALAPYLLRQLHLGMSSALPALSQPIELINRGDLADVIEATVKRQPTVPTGTSISGDQQ